jgi:molecular chaperone GrpE (heat shock protein)
MKQPQDIKTIDMLEQPKRGRGRPPVANPLSPAERARRYRERLRAIRVSTPSLTDVIRDDEHVTKKGDNETFYLTLRIQQLEAELADYKRFHEQRSDDERAFQGAYNELRISLAKAHDQIAKLNSGAVHIELQKRVDDLTGALDQVVHVTSSGARLPAHIRKGLISLLAE